MIPDVVVEVGGASIAEALFDPICRLYDEVFSEPPFRWRPEESHNHRLRLKRLMGRKTFGITSACRGNDLVGFAYGSALSPDTRWWSGMLQPAPEEITTEWEGRTFALIGRALHDTLLDSRTEERATLAVEPEAIDTQRMYRRWGWKKVGRVQGKPTEFNPFSDLMVRPLGKKDQARP